MGKVSYLRLKILLLERGVKMSELGKQIGLSSATVSKINKDDANVNLDTIIKIADYLNVDIGDIVSIKKDPQD